MGKPSKLPKELQEPESSIEVNESGGIGSSLSTRLDLTPPLAWLRVGEVLKHGADKMMGLGKAEDNWRRCPVDEHIKHALDHIAKHMAGETGDDHMGHFACRAMMALEIYLVQQKQESNK